jgi:hypothetical protein
MEVGEGQRGVPWLVYDVHTVNLEPRQKIASCAPSTSGHTLEHPWPALMASQESLSEWPPEANNLKGLTPLEQELGIIPKPARAALTVPRKAVICIALGPDGGSRKVKRDGGITVTCDTGVTLRERGEGVQAGDRLGCFLPAVRAPPREERACSGWRICGGDGGPAERGSGLTQQGGDG